MNAVQEFNAAFEANMLEPVAVPEQQAMIFLANRRQRLDLAQRLREHFDAQRISESRIRERKPCNA